VGTRLQIGDMFEVPMDGSAVRFFQYVGNDMTQLNSAVIRVFRKSYDVTEPLDVDAVTAGTVDFHAHVFLRIGLKRQLWRKVRHAQAPSTLDVLFRDSEDYGNPSIKVSRKWYVWRVNEPFQTVGKLSSFYQHAEIGVVVPADSLLCRMRTGKYDFVYPDYQ
jgi:hypothetical protein